MDRQLLVQERFFERPVKRVKLVAVKKPIVREKLEIRCIRDVRRLEKMWNALCTPKTVWDLWEIRKAFLDVYKYKVLFVEARKGKKTIGGLPLWFSKEAKKYEWISGWYAEESGPFTTNKSLVKKMIAKVDGPMSLECMDGKTARLFPGKLVRDFDHFGLSLKTVGYSWDKYLATLKTKKRQNIKRDVRSIIAKIPVVRYDNPADLKHLFRLNRMQMRRKVKMYNDESLSVFETDKKMGRAFLEMWKRSGGRYRARIITVLVGGKVVGCDFNLIYKKKYVTVLGGSNVKAVSGIGNFMNYLDIQDAINEKMEYIDFMMENHYWKEDWFKPERRYKFQKGVVKKN